MIYKLSFPRWHDVLLEIYKSNANSRYCERLKRKLKASLTHIREIVRLLADHHLIEIESGKKVKQLILTDKGKRVSVWIQEIKSELNTP